MNLPRQTVECKLLRVSFTGGPGFELHVPSDASALALYEALHTTGATLDSLPDGLADFGGFALNAFRIERGFKLRWKRPSPWLVATHTAEGTSRLLLRGDLDFAHYLEAGVDPFVSKKRAFFGRLNEDEAAGFRRTRKHVIMRVDASQAYLWSVPGDSPVCRRSDGAVVGFVTSSAFGALTKQTIALGYLNLNPCPPPPEGSASTAPRFHVPDLGADELYVRAFDQEFDITVLDRAPVPFQPLFADEL